MDGSYRLNGGRGEMVARKVVMRCARSQDSRRVRGGAVVVVRRGRGGSAVREMVRLMSLLASEEKTFDWGDGLLV